MNKDSAGMQKSKSNYQREFSFGQINFEFVTKEKEVPEDENKYQQEISALRALQENQDLRLQTLEMNIKRCKKNLILHEPHKTELTIQCSAFIEELKRIEGETKKMKETNEKKLQRLAEVKNEAEKTLQMFRNWEEKHRCSMEANNKELEDNLEKMKVKQKEKYEDSKTMYKVRELTLLHDVRRATAELEAAEKERSYREAELKVLKTANKELEGKLRELKNKKGVSSEDKLHQLEKKEFSQNQP